MGEKTKAAKAERNTAPLGFENGHSDGARWQAEKKTTRRVYLWLLLSPFITVPCFISQLWDISSRSSMGERVWAAIVPLIFYIPLLLMIPGDDRLFVRRHIQQALLLVALRAGSAAISLNVTSHLSDGSCWFLIGNGALWLFGSIAGLRQVERDDCWLMRLRGEDAELHRLRAALADEAAPPIPKPPATLPASAPVRTAPPPAARPLPEPPADPSEAFADGLRLVTTGKQTEAVARFLATFRTGPPDLRRRALAELEKLGQVETF